MTDNLVPGHWQSPFIRHAYSFLLNPRSPLVLTIDMSLSNGIYFISAQTQQKFLTFTSGSQGTTLTTWAFTGDSSQQVHPLSNDAQSWIELNHL